MKRFPFALPFAPPFLLALHLAALLSWSCASTGRAVFDHGVAGLAPADTPLAFEPGDTPLAVAVESLCAATGQTLHASPEVTAVLAAQHTTFYESLEVPAPEAYPFVEALLDTADLLLAPVPDVEEPTLGVFALDELDEAQPLVIAPDQLGNLAEHASLLVTTEITLADADAHQLSRQFAAWYFNRELETITRKNDQTLVLHGRGTWVADTAAALAILEAPETGLQWGSDDRRTPARARRRLEIPVSPKYANTSIPPPSYTLAHLLEDYARATRQHLVMPPELAERIGGIDVGLRRPARVPKREVASFVEGLCNMHGVLLTTLKAGVAPVVSVSSLWSSRESLRGSPIPASSEDLDTYLEHPALWIRTVVELPHTNTRMLQTQLRALISDTRSQGVMSLGPRHVALTGLGHYVSDLAAMLREVDAATAGKELRKPARLALPPARSPLASLPERGSLAQLVDQFGASTRQHVVASPDAQWALEQVEVEHSVSSLNASDVYAYVEAQLHNAGFALAPIKGGQAPMIGVHYLRSHEAGIKALATGLPVAGESTDLYRAHPALFARTVVEMPNVDVRTLQTQLRALLSDTSIQAMIAAGEHSLILYGLAPQVANWVDLMRAIDGYSAVEPRDTAIVSEFTSSTQGVFVLPSKALTLSEVIDLYAAGSSTVLVRSQSVRDRMTDITLEQRASIEIPAGESFAFVQALLTENGFGLEPVFGASAPMLRLFEQRRGPRGAASCRSLLIEASDAANYSDQPAFRVQTLLRLENTDPRTLVTQLRSTVADTTRQGCLSTGPNAILLQGVGPWVASMVDLVQAIDASSTIEPSSAIGLAPVQKPLRFEDEAHTLETFLAAFAAASGQHLWMTAEVREQIAEKKYKVATGRELPPHTAYSLLETVLTSEELAIAPVKGGKEAILGIYPFDTLKVHGKPVAVAPESVAKYAEEHPALFIATVVPIENADARSLHQQMRRQITHSGYQTLMAGGSKKLVVIGLAPWVAEMVANIQDADV